MRCLRFDKKTTLSERRKTDHLAAIRSIYDQFNENLVKNYVCGPFIRVREKLERFFGRCLSVFICLLNQQKGDKDLCGARFRISIYFLSEHPLWQTTNS